MIGDYAHLLRLLPVRHPMVLVDRVVSLEPGGTIEVEKAVTGGELCYAGLAEGLPSQRYAYPRPLILESFGQASALLWLGSVGPSGADSSGAGPSGAEADGVPMVGRLRNCVFHSSVYPGDLVHHRIQIETMVQGNAIMSGESRVGDRTVLTVGSLIAVARPRDDVLANR